MNASYVSNGKPRVAGAIYRAPLTVNGTAVTPPTDASTPIDTTIFTELGYVSDEGLTNDMSSSSDSLKAWGGYTVMTTNSEVNDNFSFTLIESLNIDVLKTVYGEAHVAGDLANGISIDKTADEATDYIWVVDMVMRNGILKRLVIPQGKVSELGEVVYNDNDAVGYALTVAASYVNGASHHEYIKQP